MKTPNWHIAQRNLKLAPYHVAAGALGGAILAVWVPLHPSFLGLAAGLGAAGFAIQWLGVRCRTHLGPLGTILCVLGLLAGRGLLPKMDRTELLLNVLQFMAIWIFAFAILHVLFRKQLSRDLVFYAPD